MHDGGMNLSISVWKDSWPLQNPHLWQHLAFRSGLPANIKTLTLNTNLILEAKLDHFIDCKRLFLLKTKQKTGNSPVQNALKSVNWFQPYYYLKPKPTNPWTQMQFHLYRSLIAYSSLVFSVKIFHLLGWNYSQVFILLDAILSGTIYSVSFFGEPAPSV